MRPGIKLIVFPVKDFSLFNEAVIHIRIEIWPLIQLVSEELFVFWFVLGLFYWVASEKFFAFRLISATEGLSKWCFKGFRRHTIKPLVFMFVDSPHVMLFFCIVALSCFVIKFFINSNLIFSDLVIIIINFLSLKLGWIGNQRFHLLFQLRAALYRSSFAQNVRVVSVVKRLQFPFAINGFVNCRGLVVDPSLIRSRHFWFKLSNVF